MRLVEIVNSPAEAPLEGKRPDGRSTTGMTSPSPSCSVWRPARGPGAELGQRRIVEAGRFVRSEGLRQGHDDRDRTSYRIRGVGNRAQTPLSPRGEAGFAPKHGAVLPHRSQVKERR